MKLLVTGAGGFVGSHVVEQAQRLGWDVFGIDVDSSWPRAADVVVSLAATADPNVALADPRAAYLNDVGVMLDTLDYAQWAGAHVLHVSTNEVYGREVARYGDGRDMPVYDPWGPYAGGKACQEIVCQAQDAVPVTVVVTQSLFGERQQPNKLVPSVIRSLLAGTPVTLQGNAGLWATRPFLYVGDLVRVLLECAEDRPDFDRFHVGATSQLSVKQVAQALAYGLDVAWRAEQVPAGDRPGHDLEPAPIGWDWDGQPTDALEVLPRLARWYRDHPEWL